MTLTYIGFMLLGAFLLAAGVVIAATADRIRDRRSRPYAEYDEYEPRQPIVAAQKVPKMSAVPAFNPSDTIFVPDDDPAATRRGDRALPNNKPVPIDTGMAADVVNALVAAGYHKRAATSAVQACDASERGSLADWTRAALRRSRGEVMA